MKYIKEHQEQKWKKNVKRNENKMNNPDSVCSVTDSCSNYRCSSPAQSYLTDSDLSVVCECRDGV